MSDKSRNQQERDFLYPSLAEVVIRHQFILTLMFYVVLTVEINK
jgi:hypothetical protein